jgi:hypothetical protein
VLFLVPSDLQGLPRDRSDPWGKFQLHPFRTFIFYFALFFFPFSAHVARVCFGGRHPRRVRSDPCFSPIPSPRRGTLFVAPPRSSSPRRATSLIPRTTCLSTGSSASPNRYPPPHHYLVFIMTMMMIGLAHKCVSCGSFTILVPPLQKE